jgi:hypothetical protein
MTGKVLFDVGQALRLTVVQWQKHRAFCIWCLGAPAPRSQRCHWRCVTFAVCCVRDLADAGVRRVCRVSGPAPAGQF